MLSDPIYDIDNLRIHCGEPEDRCNINVILDEANIVTLTWGNIFSSAFLDITGCELCIYCFGKCDGTSAGSCEKEHHRYFEKEWKF